VPFLAAEPGQEESGDDLGGEGTPDDPAPYGDHVGVVVFDRLMCRVGVVSEDRPDSVDFVGGDGGTGSRSAHDHSSIGSPVPDRSADGGCEVGIVNRLLRVCPQIEDGIAFLRQQLGQVFLQPEPGMVGSDGNAHVISSLGSQRVAPAGPGPLRMPDR